MADPAPRLPLGYLIAAAATAAVALFRYALADVLGDAAPTIPFVLPVILAAWYGGARPGLLATALGAAAGCYLFVPPHFSFRLTSPAEGLALGLYVASGVMISGLCGALHGARRRAEAEADRRARVEAEGRAARDRLAATLDGLADGFWQLDRDWRFVYVNPAAGRSAGRPTEEIVGRTLWEAFPGVAGSVVETEYRKALAGRVAVEFETRDPSSDRWFGVRAFPTEDGGLAVLSRDVTAARRAEQELRDREATLRAFFDSSPVFLGVTELTPDGDVLHLSDNPATCRFFGVPPGATAGKRALAELGADPAVVAVWREAYRASAAARAPVRFEHEHRGAQGPRWLAATVSPIDPGPGGPPRFCYVAEDVTDRKAAEAAVRAGEERFRLAAGATGVTLFEQDADLRYLWLHNPIAGYTLDGIIGKTDAEIAHTIADPAALVRAKHEVLATGRGVRVEVVNRPPGGGEEYHDLTLEPRRDPGGRVAGVVGASVNVTDRRRVEHALRDRERLLSGVLGSVTDGFYVLDREARFAFVNDALVARFGRPREEVLGQNIWELFPRAVGGEAHARLTRALADRAGVEYEVYYGPWDRWFADKAYPTADGGLAVYSRDVTQARRAAERLRQTEERFRLAAEAVNGLIYEYDLGTGRVERTRGLFEVFGYRPDEAPPTGDWWRGLVHPDDLAAADRAYAEQAAAGGPVRSEYRVRHRDGRWVHVEDRAVVQRDPGGRPVRLVGCTVDVTARKAAEAALRRYAIIFENQTDAIILTDLAGRILDWNPACERMLGYAKAEVLGRTTALFHRPEDAASLTRDALAATERDGVWRGEITFVRKDGTLGVCETVVKPLADDAGRAVGAVGVNRDITDRKRVEDALTRERELLRTIIDRIPVMVTLYRPDARLLRVNPEFERVTGWPAAAAAGASLMEACYPDPAYRAEVAAFMAACRDGWMDVRMRTRDGRDVDTSWANLRLSDGTRVGIGIDITDRKAAEDALREADKRKDEFLATLAHELRNPLAPIRNAVQILKARGPADDGLAWSRSVIDRQVAQMARLLDDLLDVSRISRGKIELRPARVALGSVVEAAAETSRPLVEAGGHALTVDLPADPVWLDADPVRLAQVFANLLNNAAKYTPPGGRIRLTARADGGWVAAAVADTGIGIAPDMLGRVFEMFSQAAPALERAQGGLGIGLSLVKGLVELHGGTVEARSGGPGRGSEFVVRLPVAAGAAPAEAARPAPAARPCGTGCKILVADDNRDAADSLALMLTLQGHEVRTAADGQEAVEVAEALRPDVAFLDIGMPRVNGYEAARRIRERAWGAEVVLVALTGWGQEEDRRRSRAAGFDHHFTKPVEADVLDGLLATLKPAGA